MDLDDIFDKGHNRRHQNYDHNYKHEDDYRHENEQRSAYLHGRQNDNISILFERLNNNPKIKMVLMFSFVAIIVILIGLIILLFPFILKVFGFVSEQGLEGLINSIWKGTK